MEQSLDALVTRVRELLEIRQAEFDARMAILEIADGRALTDVESAEYRQRTNAIIELDCELDRLEIRIDELRD
jgi:hypothetical protein